MRLRLNRGFTLVELMVAVALAGITGLVVLQVLSNYQSRKQLASGRNDAQVSASVGLFAMEREIRMAGAGFTLPTGMLCNAGINIAYNGVTVSNGAPVRPIRINDGGTAPDSIDVLRGDSDFGSAPTTVLQLMASPTQQIVVDANMNLAAGDLIVAGAYDGSKVCTLMQVSANPTANSNAWNLMHASGTGLPYNTASPALLFTTAVSYDVRDIVMNLGTHGWRRFSVVCNDGNRPSGSNNCDLASYDLLAVAAPTLATVQSESAQVIDLQAQYGIAPAGSQTVDTWVNATGGWAAPAEADQRRIKAVRVSIVARGARDAQTVSPASLTLWNDGNGNVKTRSLSDEERHYRYQILTVIVPLINTIWANV